MLAGEGIPTAIAIQVNHVDLPFRSNLLTKDQRLPKMVTCIEKENRQAPLNTGCHVQERHRLRLERRTESDLRPECIYCPPYDFLRHFALEFLRQPFYLGYR